MATNKSTNYGAAGNIKAPAPTVNTSKGMASKADCCRPEHRSPEKMLSHMKQTCNGGKCNCKGDCHCK